MNWRGSLSSGHCSGSRKALFGSLINTGANVADKWQSYSQAGVDPFAVGAF